MEETCQSNIPDEPANKPESEAGQQFAISMELKIFSEKKMAPALDFCRLSHALAPTQTALRQPLGKQTLNTQPGQGGSSHPSLPASERAVLPVAARESPGPQRLVAGRPQQGAGRAAAFRVSLHWGKVVADTPRVSLVSLREHPSSW